MTHPHTTLLSSLLLAFSLGAAAMPITKAEYKTEKSSISAKLKSDKAACASLSGNAKDVCIEEAKGAEKVAMAELEAKYDPSMRHTYDVKVAKAKAAYAIAKEKCDDLSGNPKNVCRKEASEAYTTAMAQAKLTEKTMENNATAMDKNANAKREANSEIRDAEYKTAIEKCDAFTGDVKAKCIAQAKTQYSK